MSALFRRQSVKVSIRSPSHVRQRKHSAPVLPSRCPLVFLNAPSQMDSKSCIFKPHVSLSLGKRRITGLGDYSRRSEKLLHEQIHAPHHLRQEKVLPNLVKGAFLFLIPRRRRLQAEVFGWRTGRCRITSTCNQHLRGDCANEGRRRPDEGDVAGCHRDSRGRHHFDRSFVRVKPEWLDDRGKSGALVDSATAFAGSFKIWERRGGLSEMTPI